MKLSQYPVIKPVAILWSSRVIFVMALWPLATLQIGRPKGGAGESIFLVSLLLPLLAGPSLSALMLLDILRRKKWNGSPVALTFSLSESAAVAAYICTRIN